MREYHRRQGEGRCTLQLHTPRRLPLGEGRCWLRLLRAQEDALKLIIAVLLRVIRSYLASKTRRGFILPTREQQLDRSRRLMRNEVEPSLPR